MTMDEKDHVVKLGPRPSVNWREIIRQYIKDKDSAQCGTIDEILQTFINSVNTVPDLTPEQLAKEIEEYVLLQRRQD
jgi:hypothetical protein